MPVPLMWVWEKPMIVLSEMWYPLHQSQPSVTEVGPS